MLKVRKNQFQDIVMLTISLLFFCFFKSSIAMSSDSPKKVAPLAVDGTIDLSDWDFKKDGVVSLKGQWRFVWKEFVEPGPVDEIWSKHTGQIKVPGFWQKQLHPARSPEYLPKSGFGTYMLRIKLP